MKILELVTGLLIVRANNPHEAILDKGIFYRVHCDEFALATSHATGHHLDTVATFVKLKLPTRDNDKFTLKVIDREVAIAWLVSRHIPHSITE